MILRNDLIPEIRARLAREYGCRPGDLNITQIIEHVVSEEAARTAAGGQLAAPACRPLNNLGLGVPEVERCVPRRSPIQEP